MMYNLRKPLSFLLSLSLLFTVFFSAPFHVNAAGNNYLEIIQSDHGEIIRENYKEDDWNHTGYEVGTRILLSVDPEEDYELEDWDVKFQDGTVIDVIRGYGKYYYFDIPQHGDGANHISIRAAFVKIGTGSRHTAAILPGYEGGTENKVTLESGNTSDRFKPGEAVYVEIEWEPSTRFRTSDGGDPDRYKLRAYYTKNGVESDVPIDPSPAQYEREHEYFFIMPDADVSVTCEFEYLEYDITYEYVLDPGVSEDDVSKPYFVLNGDSMVLDQPIRTHAGTSVDIFGRVQDSEYCFTGVTMEYTDGEGNFISRQLAVNPDHDGAHTLHADFDMPSSGVNLKFTFSRVYKVNIDASAQDLVFPYPKNAMEGDRVGLEIAEDDYDLIDRIQVRDSQGNEIEINDDHLFTMPADDVTVYARVREKYIERSWDGEQVVETEKVIPEDAVDISSINGNVLEQNTFYVVRGDQTFNGSLFVAHQAIIPDSTVNILLCEGSTLDCEGIDLTPGVTLNIFDQRGGTGKLISRAHEDAAGIGSSSGNTGSINIHGGNITAEALDGAAIGGGNGGSPEAIRIYSGKILARTAGSGAGIGGGSQGQASSGEGIFIYGGTINAFGMNDGAGIGNGAEASGSVGAINIHGGTVNAQSGDGESSVIDSYYGGAGIGAGRAGTNGPINIYGGTVRARSVMSRSLMSAYAAVCGAGIGSGDHEDQGAPIIISGGDVEAVSDYGAGIGAGNEGAKGGVVKITGGTVTAYSISGEQAIGHGDHISFFGEEDGNLEIYNTAKVEAGESSNTAQLQQASQRVEACHDNIWVRIRPCDHPQSDCVCDEYQAFRGHYFRCRNCNISFNEGQPHRYLSNGECRDCHYRSTVTVQKVWGEDQADHPEEVEVKYISIWQSGDEQQIDWDNMVTLSAENDWKATIPAGYGYHKLIFTEEAEGYAPESWTLSSPDLPNNDIELPEDDIVGSGSGVLDLIDPPDDDSYYDILLTEHGVVKLKNTRTKKFIFKKQWPGDDDFDIDAVPDQITLNYNTAEGGDGEKVIKKDENWTAAQNIPFSDSITLTEEEMEDYTAAGWIVEGGGEKVVVPMKHGDMNTVTIPPANYDELDVPQETRNRIATALAADTVTITVVNTEKVTYSVDKKWVIDFADKDRPDEISVVLQRRDNWRTWTTMELLTLDTLNNWSSEFVRVPKAVLDEDPTTHEIALENYKYRIRELGPKKNEGDPDPDPTEEDFEKKIRSRLVYDMWDLDKDLIKNLINKAKNPDTYWKWEPDIDWVKSSVKSVVIPPAYVCFEIEGYNDGVKEIEKHTTKYMVKYKDSSRTNKTTVTNTAALDVSIYKRWLNFNDGEVPEYVYLMLMSKVQKDYAERLGEDAINIYTPCMSGILGDYKITDLPGLEDATKKVKSGISSTMGDNAVSEIATDEFIELQIKKYLSTGLCLKKVKEKHTNPLLKWSTEFTVKKYGMGDLKLPMDFAGTELVTGLMEMVIDAIIKYFYPESNIHIPVMYQPFDSYWSITGYSLNLFRDYELTSNVINFKFHGSDHGEVVGGTKYWKGDKEEDRPESVKIHVYYKDGSGAEKEVRGSPVVVKKGDSNGSNGWVWALEIPKDSEDYGKDYYIREEVPAGYTEEYCGKNNWDVINTKSGGTDPTEPTQAPTESPTTAPTESPTTAPTESPTSAPTEPPGPTPTEPAGDTGKLRITATRPDEAKAKEQSYVYDVVGPDSTKLTVGIVLKAGETSGSVTISHLNPGAYTVTEKRTWSWRYSDGKNQSATVVADDTAQVTFDHTLDLFEWLNGYSHRYSR